MPIQRSERDKTCGNCKYWDTEAPDHTEVLARPFDRNTRFTCRLLPAEEFKSAADWCGQHEPAQS